ncbi:UNKNOWN [Stylonychia lemnae]|uniref:Uncharacterized protein n=1 Tax=Stylonychia lemnae TaxID=5949 RepID=A0A078AMX6_STYLE|nr:UNKNOWN [Stylonychia lemnae]|eukprot:CDW82238.1 UNKNOWN [Stylonychia lemnae]
MQNIYSYQICVYSPETDKRICDGYPCIKDTDCVSQQCINDICVVELQAWAVFTLTIFGIFVFVGLLRGVIVFCKRRYYQKIINKLYEEFKNQQNDSEGIPENNNGEINLNDNQLDDESIDISRADSSEDYMEQEPGNNNNNNNRHILDTSYSENERFVNNDNKNDYLIDNDLSRALSQINNEIEQDINLQEEQKSED